MIPALREEQLIAMRSQAEAAFYVACRDSLDSDVVVIHSLALLRLTGAGGREDSEADFVVIDPTRGIAVVEVKGGGVEFNPSSRTWFSNGKNGRHEIKDPFRQAHDQKRALIEFVRKIPTFASRRLLFAHGAFFPDVDRIDAIRQPSIGPAMVGGRFHLGDLRTWLWTLFDYWRGQDERSVPPGAAGTATLEQLLCGPIKVRPLIAKEIADEEAVRVTLTQQQARLLRALGSRRRALICGGAGTGKTLLAMERARELAAQGLRTLLVCYNRPLADHLKAAVQGVDNLHAMTFHQLCDWRISVARAETAKDFLVDAVAAYPAADRFKLQLPFALALAVEATEFRYDAIIVDEAQDFGAEFWLGLDTLLANEKESWLYVFYDHNQAIYANAPMPPIDDAPFILTTNCRNTSIIHAAAYKYYSGPETDAPVISGAAMEVMAISNEAKRVAWIQTLVCKLISEEGVSPTDIAVLVVQGGSQALCNALATRPLPRGASWGIRQHRLDGSVVIDTVSRFKGLEAAIVVLCNFEDVDIRVDCELCYVGLSRAKSRIYLVGGAAAIETIRGGNQTLSEKSAG
jgi:AAA domain/Nuclease-related domain/UvrD-like helicase C-terminal domain